MGVLDSRELIETWPNRDERIELEAATEYQDEAELYLIEGLVETLIDRYVV